GPWQRPGELKNGEGAIGSQLRGPFRKIKIVRAFLTGLGLDLECGRDPEAPTVLVDSLVKHREESGYAEQVTGVGQLPVAGDPVQFVRFAGEHDCVVVSRKIGRDTRHLDDVQGLDIVEE